MSNEITQKEMLRAVWEKMEKMSEDVADMKVTLAKQAVVLEDHTRRSLANEKHVAVVEEKLTNEIQPMKLEMAKLSGMIKLIGGMIALGSMIAGFLQVFMGK